MEGIQEQFKRLQVKLQELLRRHAAARKELERLQKINAELSARQEQQEQKIRLLEEQQYLLKSAAGQFDEKEKKALEQSINRYIREIDKCIALLSE